MVKYVIIVLFKIFKILYRWFNFIIDLKILDLMKKILNLLYILFNLLLKIIFNINYDLLYL